MITNVVVYSPGPTTINGVNLGTTPLGYAFKSGNAAPLLITYSGGVASDSNPGANWQAMAATLSGSGYQLFWRNNLSSQYARWFLDANGALSSASFLSTSDLYATELSLNLDLNQDNTIGPATPSTGNSNRTIVGRFDTPGEIDSYNIDVVTGTILMASVTTASTQALYPLVDLLSTNGTLLKGANNYNKDLANLGMVDLVSGKGTLRIRNQTGLVGDYELKLIFISREAFKADVVNLTNAERLKAGLNPLSRNALLDQAAQAHVEDMDASNRYLAHTGSNGSDPVSRISATSYRGAWWISATGNCARSAVRMQPLANKLPPKW